ncbi:Iron-sulfur protein IND1 like [Verticillium longisporum]|uniref:Iron-sulfur protein IND1 like n=1 Tax=Verticillium longisporum TaxID=100787 RepID=A0A8I3APC7_VERLO|nr:Iron-sulfur protein IND1 like [Verticillium longisporum]
MRPTLPRLLQPSIRLLGHENPLGLPRSGTPPHWPKRPERRPIRNVAKVIAVSSAKGGVGKSTVAANLSLAFARLGYRSGILDVDIFGPSVPTLFNLSGEPRLSAHNQLVPLTNYGVKTMSMGYLVDEAAPVVWRGPMVMKSVQQLLHDVDWGGLDVLVLDLPPGTGDTQLTITQQVLLDGALIVTTPHALAVKDAVKGVNMFKKVGVDILGLVQNMSLFTCPHCAGHTNVFGTNERVETMCREHAIEFLADVPLHPAIGDDADRGKPTVVAEPTSERASVFVKMAEDVAAKLNMSRRHT